MDVKLEHRDLPAFLADFHGLRDDELDLPSAVSRRRDQLVHFVVRIADESVVLEGTGEVELCIDHGRSVPAAERYEVTLRLSRLDDKSKVIAERLRMVRAEALEMNEEGSEQWAARLMAELEVDDEVASPAPEVIPPAPRAVPPPVPAGALRGRSGESPRSPRAVAVRSVPAVVPRPSPKPAPATAALRVAKPVLAAPLPTPARSTDRSLRSPRPPVAKTLATNRVLPPARPATTPGVGTFAVRRGVGLRPARPPVVARTAPQSPVSARAGRATDDRANVVIVRAVVSVGEAPQPAGGRADATAPSTAKRAAGA